MASASKQIRFTSIANVHLEHTIEYLLNEFGHSSAEKFLQLLKKKLNAISEQKIVHRYFYKTKQVRYFILQKNYVLYLEKKNVIQVVAIYGTKQKIRGKNR